MGCGAIKKILEGCLDKPFNSGQWTKARMHSFIKSALRTASMKWPPRNLAIKNARVERGMYLCAGCGNIVPASVKIGNKRHKNAIADHIKPVVDPAVGFVSWDELISRLFCEVDGFQVLCKECHDSKTKQERELARSRK